MNDPLPLILVANLFPVIEGKLVELLHSLSNDEWEQQTVSPRWKVKDVAAHLLDTQLRKLSIARDSYAPGEPAIASPNDLVDFINRLNAQGVAIYRCLSPAVLIALMEWASAESAAYHQALDPSADARFPVSWAGDTTSPNWFDTAREFTERWHHQQQIREATGRPGIMTRALYFPVLDCFMRALPFAYRTQPAPPGALLRFTVSGECGGNWFLFHEDVRWRLVTAPAGAELSHTTIPQEIAWRIFTKGIDRDAARPQITVAGDSALGFHILNMVTIVG